MRGLVGAGGGEGFEVARGDRHLLHLLQQRRHHLLAPARARSQYESQQEVDARARESTESGCTRKKIDAPCWVQEVLE